MALNASLTPVNSIMYVAGGFWKVPKMIVASSYLHAYEIPPFLSVKCSDFLLINRNCKSDVTSETKLLKMWLTFEFCLSSFFCLLIMINELPCFDWPHIDLRKEGTESSCRQNRQWRDETQCLKNSPLGLTPADNYVRYLESRTFSFELWEGWFSHSHPDCSLVVPLLTP